MGTIQSSEPVGPIRKNVMFEGVEYFNGDGTADIGFQFDNGSPISLIVSTRRLIDVVPYPSFAWIDAAALTALGFNLGNRIHVQYLPRIASEGF